MELRNVGNSASTGILDDGGEKFRCPGDTASRKFANADEALKDLLDLIDDPVTSENKDWIGRLLEEFLGTIGDDGYKMEQLSGVMRLLEFLSWRATDVDEYREHLDRMLDLCARMPLLTKTREILNFAGVLEQYFTMLGYLMAIVPTNREMFLVCEAIDRPLDESNPARISTITLQYNREAMEKSRLPIIIAEFVRIASPKIYLRVLSTVHLISRISLRCCHMMLKAGTLNHLLTRMDPAQEDRSAESYKEEMIIATSILWNLIRSILPPNEFAPDLQNLPGPKTPAMRSLRDAFRKQVAESQESARSLMLRDELSIIILAALVGLPFWHLVRCGLAEDLVLLAVATESEIEGTWAEKIKFGTSNEDLYFKKILLLILYHLSDRGAAIAIMVKRKVIAAILDLVNPTIVDSHRRWSPAQFWYLSQFAMPILARLALKMPQEFVLYNGPVRIRMLVGWSLTVEFDSHTVLQFTKTICSIIKCSAVLNKFREEEIIASLIDLVNRILTFDRLTMHHQRILTIAIIAIEDLAKSGERRFDHRYRGHSLRMIMSLLQRCSKQTEGDFQLDQRLLISIGSYIWKCVVSCPERIRKFVDIGGIYTILDVIENAIFPVRCIYLGILTDVCSAGHGAPHLSTWRGVDKTRGFMSLLARSWREEEIRTGVKRTSDGCIEDAELPIMGTEQWIHAFHARSTPDSSPALASFVGSVRTKIYSIRKIMTNECDRFDKSKEHYKVLLNDMPIEDRITMYIADHLYRFAQGQLWSEISRYLEQVGVHLLGMDGEITFLMNQRHRGWGMYVRGLQDKLLSDERKRESVRELETMAKIRNSKLGSSLNALQEIEYIRRTTDREYTTVNMTFPEKWNFSISQQMRTIPSEGPVMINQNNNTYHHTKTKK